MYKTRRNPATRYPCLYGSFEGLGFFKPPSQYNDVCCPVESQLQGDSPGSPARTHDGYRFSRRFTAPFFPEGTDKPWPIGIISVQAPSYMMNCIHRPYNFGLGG